MHSCGKGKEKLTRGSLFFMLVKLVQIKLISSDNYTCIVCIRYSSKQDVVSTAILKIIPNPISTTTTSIVTSSLLCHKNESLLYTCIIIPCHTRPSYLWFVLGHFDISFMLNLYIRLYSSKGWINYTQCYDL